ncbi:DUF3617 domain-containing protein [Rhodoblastus sp.]|uniref:DUF3617 domain-containing protein n=1 Tax=Rhodoblastus sp. TaxID=1962975 RepID=UPI003F955452
MKTVRALWFVTAVGAGCAISAVAWASHGKAGLWEITVRNAMDRTPGMPDLSQLPPEARARIEAAVSKGVTVRHCMTEADVNNDTRAWSNQTCKTTNTRRSGQTFSLDLVCAGKMTGHGHVEYTYDSPEHYSGVQNMSVIVNGQTVTHTTNIDAQWVSADCGGAP